MGWELHPEWGYEDPPTPQWGDASVAKWGAVTRHPQHPGQAGVAGGLVGARLPHLTSCTRSLSSLGASEGASEGQGGTLNF